MKNLLLILGIAICTIFSTFGSISSKGSLDNFIFLNSEVKNAVVETNTNEYTFYFDNTINNYEEYSISEIFTINSNSQAYYVLNGTNNFVDSDLNGLILGFFGEFYSDLTFKFYSGSNANQFSINSEIGDDSIIMLSKGSSDNIWNLYTDNGYSNDIIALKFLNVNLSDSLDNLNPDLEPYIGNLTSLPSEEPIPEPDPGSIESSIGNVIRGIIDWFVDIFNGLADAFVIIDSTGQFIGFTIWGQVLFIEVGIGLVILVLKWVISLVRGV